MIIAEVGQNFQGDIGLAKHLIYLAKENGADLAKFQLYSNSDKRRKDHSQSASLVAAVGGERPQGKSRSHRSHLSCPIGQEGELGTCLLSELGKKGVGVCRCPGLVF